MKDDLPFLFGLFVISDKIIVTQEKYETKKSWDKNGGASSIAYSICLCYSDNDFKNNEWHRFMNSPLDGKISMSFALQWRYNSRFLFPGYTA